MRHLRRNQNLLQGANAPSQRKASFVQAVPPGSYPALQLVESQAWNDCAVQAYATLFQMSYKQARYRLRSAYNPGTGCHPERFCRILCEKHNAKEVWPLNKKKRAVLILNWGGPDQWGHVALHNPTQGVVGDIWGRELHQHLAKVLEIP